MHPIAKDVFVEWTFRVQRDLGVTVEGNGSAFVSAADQAIKFGKNRDPSTGKPFEYDAVWEHFGTTEHYKAKTFSNAKPGDSYHQYGCAADPLLVDAYTGKPAAWNGTKYEKAADVGEQLDVKWGNNFEKVKQGTQYPDPQHFQYTRGIPVEVMKARNERGQDVFTGE
jgi:peptidoglycan LD-endopeptidase CwlK